VRRGPPIFPRELLPCRKAVNSPHDKLTVQALSALTRIQVHLPNGDATV